MSNAKEYGINKSLNKDKAKNKALIQNIDKRELTKSGLRK